MVICLAGVKHRSTAATRQVDALMAQGQDYRQRADSFVELQRLALHQAAIFEAQAIELAARAKRAKGVAVRAGVPIAEAMEALALLLATAQSSAYAVATHAERVNETPGAAWAPVYLLEMAEYLHAAIQAKSSRAWRAFSRFFGVWVHVLPLCDAARARAEKREKTGAPSTLHDANHTRLSILDLRGFQWKESTPWLCILFTKAALLFNRTDFSACRPSRT
eukprot:gene47142-58831_t